MHSIIDFRVIRELFPHRRGKQIGFPANYRAEPEAQKFELAPCPLELIGMCIPADHDCGAFGRPMILPQRYVVALARSTSFSSAR